MRQCRFCRRWFKNKQAVRRHLGYCSTYQAIPPEQRTQREEIFRCATCVEHLGPEHTTVVTSNEMHELAAAHGGCITCGGSDWARAGWRRVAAST